MKNLPTFENVCRESWMSGSLKVHQSAESVTLEKRTSIPFLVLWCAFIMGGVLYFVNRNSDSTVFTVVFFIVSILLISLFVGVALVLNKKPCILRFDKSTQTVSSPRVEGLSVHSSKVELWLVPAWVYRHYSRERHLSQIVVLYLSETNTEVPVFCELSNTLRSKLQNFSEVSELPMRVTEPRTIHVHPSVKKPRRATTTTRSF